MIEQIDWLKICAKILKRDHYTCKACGRKFPKGKLIVHHINGGGDREDNLITLCLHCRDFVQAMNLHTAGEIIDCAKAKPQTRGRKPENGHVKNPREPKFITREDGRRVIDWHAVVYGGCNRHTC